MAAWIRVDPSRLLLSAFTHSCFLFPRQSTRGLNYVDNPLRWEAGKTASQGIKGEECDSRGVFIWHVDDILAKYVTPKEKPEVGPRVCQGTALGSQVPTPEQQLISPPGFWTIYKIKQRVKMETKILISLWIEVKPGHTGLLTELQGQETSHPVPGAVQNTHFLQAGVLSPESQRNLLFSPRPCFFPMRQEGKELGSRFQIL